MKVTTTLKIISNNTHNYLEIWDDKSRRMVSEKNIDEYVFESCKYGVYKLRIITNDNCIITSFYTSHDCKHIIDARKKCNTQKIFINLYDQNYSGLRIEKGELKFWKTNMILR